MRITKKYLNELLAEIAKLENKALTSEEAIAKGLDYYYFLEDAPIYGGYRVVNVKVGSGAHCGAFGGNGCEARLKAKEMGIKLESIISGLLINKVQNGTLRDIEPIDNYYMEQLNKVNPKLTEYAPTVKIFANGNGEDTKNLSLNKDSAKVLIEWLTKEFC